MMRRLSAGVMLVAVAVMLTSTTAFAKRPDARPFVGDPDPYSDDYLPLMQRAGAGTTWVSVGQAGCDSANASPINGQTLTDIWCFDQGDSLWPNGPGGTTRRAHWDHYSKFDPPELPDSKWKITTFAGQGVGDQNAFGGCEGAADCPETAFWVFTNGYGDDWNFPLQLDMSAADTDAGGTLTFDVRYDTECVYDYLYLEYMSATTTSWTLMTATGAGVVNAPTIFNGVSGVAPGTDGDDCGMDVFDHGDGPAGAPVYGTSTWVTGVTVTVPSESDLFVRWRAFSDGAWSDQGGQADTDGMGAIDNVSVTLSNESGTWSDDFDGGADFNTTGDSDFVSGNPLIWEAQGLTGTTFDSWTIEADPMYKNKGNTCTFSDSWMWACRPPGGAFENGFDFFLVSPAIGTVGWTGAVATYDQYICFIPDTEDFSDTLVRVYDSAVGDWGAWQNIDGFITFSGCEFWNVNSVDDISTFITSTTDSLQYAWEALDISQDGEFSWDNHQTVQFLLDNVSFGSFDGQATQFALSVVNNFVDTFSLTDPAHTSSLTNDEQNDWIGNGGTRAFEAGDSLAVTITDFNGVTAPDSGGPGNVTINWRIDDGGGSPGAWSSKDMKLQTQIPTSTSNEGTYTAIIGNDTTEDANLPNGNGLIWTPGTSIQYYIKVIDDAANTATFPLNFDTAPFAFKILPFGNTTANGNEILVVDDYGRNNLDVQNSTGFDPVGGSGNGTFNAAVFNQPELLVLDALDIIYGIDYEDTSLAGIVDDYDVGGAGTGAQAEPNGFAIESGATTLVGGYMTAAGIPAYDALIWLHGTFDEDTYLDSTRIELRTFLDNGGQMVSFGDGVATHLGSGGSNADSTIGFMNDYMSITLPVDTDIETIDRTLSASGEAGTEYAGFELGVYGECPVIRAFDKLTLTTSPGATSASRRVLFSYANGDASDNGRSAVIENVTTGGGRTIHSGFGAAALLSRNAIACYLDVALHDIMGLTDPGYTCPAPVDFGTDTPDIANSAFGFDLAAASPNPFNDATSIRFAVPSRAHVSIEIYNILGQKVRTLVDESMEANSYVRTWDGRSDNGEQVSSGIYFYKMVSGQFSDTKKAVLLK